jgi:hypothetical protein
MLKEGNEIHAKDLFIDINKKSDFGKLPK